MSKRSNYGGLDVFRIIAAILVVAIHTSPLASLSDCADFFLTRVLARIAVPFFFMVTGQFILSDYVYGEAKSVSRIVRYIKGILMLYGVSVLLYLPVGIYAGHYRTLTAGSALRMLLFDGTFYHLWYFPACIIGILLICLLRRYLSFKGVAAVSGGLYVFGLLGDSYYGLTTQIPALNAVYEFTFQIWSYTRNGLFLAPIFLLMGAMSGRKINLMRRKYTLIGLIISFALMTAEAFALRSAGWQMHDSMYLTLIPVMYFLYLFLLSFRVKPSRLYRKIAAWIYILHPLIIVLFRGIAKVSHLSVLVDNNIVHYLTVILISAVSAFLITVLLGSGSPRTGDAGRAWIELDRSALRNNVMFLRSRLPERCQLMPAIKANAYGHGAVLIARELQRLNIHAFCVACVREGIELRKAGIKGEILILGYTHPTQFHLLTHYRLSQTVVDYPYAQQLNQYGKRLRVHVGIDTGMHRLGVSSENIEQICSIFCMKNLVIDGLFTHLSADDSLEPAERAFTDQQAQRFYRIVEELKKRNIPVPKLHLQSSYGVLNYPELSEDYARVGIALYGVLSTAADAALWKDSLQPVLSLKARVASVRTINSGEPAGYGLQFVAKHPMKIATLAIGYADGLPRSLSDGKGAVLIHGKKATIIGKICMDQTLADVTDIAGVRAGDIAVLIGKSGTLEISACDVAEQAGTISNEVLSRLGSRLDRSYQ